MLKSATYNKNGFTPFANGGSQILLQSIQEYNATFAESIYLIFISSINAFPENVLIIWVLTKYLLVNPQWMYI